MLGLNSTLPLKTETPPASSAVSSCQVHGHRHSPYWRLLAPLPPLASVQVLLTASFSGLQTFTHRIWSRSQSMGLSR